MWQCTPSSTTAGERRMRSTARCASPLPRLKPNLLSSWPVAMNSWVCACTPGVMRSQHLRHGEALARAALERSSSSKLSTTMWRTPSVMAMRSSATLLLLPWKASALAGTPARRRRTARRRWPRRGACPPRTPGGPWPCTGTPWWRRTRAVTERATASRSGAQVRLVVDEQRRAELRRELVDTAATDGQRTVGSTVAWSGKSCSGTGFTCAPGPRCPAGPDPAAARAP
jgi:hypothetical protein